MWVGAVTDIPMHCKECCLGSRGSSGFYYFLSSQYEILPKSSNLPCSMLDWPLPVIISKEGGGGGLGEILVGQKSILFGQFHQKEQ